MREQIERTDMQGTGAQSHEIENIILLGERALGATPAKLKFLGRYWEQGGGEF